jgi:hypothetical protein
MGGEESRISIACKPDFGAAHIELTRCIR